MTCFFRRWDFSMKAARRSRIGVEHTACLARADHVDVELVEGLGVLGEGLGERGAAFDVFRDVDELVLEHAGLLLFFEDLQAADDRQAGVLKGGELAGEGAELLGLDLAHGEGFLLLASAARGALAFGGLLLDVGREVALVANLDDRLFVRDGVDFALDFLALAV